MQDPYRNYRQKVLKAKVQLHQIKKQKSKKVVLKAKSDSHLFRGRFQQNYFLDLKRFNQVIQFNLKGGWIDVEGMITYQDLVDFLLPLKYMPKIVPELKTITVGGAISGVGIEASSFKYGLIHSTIQEMDVLTGQGDLLTCKSTGEHKDLFHGLPNSYGVFGYILRARVEIIPIKSYVQLMHSKFDDPIKAFRKLKESSEDLSLDFVEGVVFAKNDIRILTGKCVEEAPQDYLFKDFRIRNIFYKQLKNAFKDIEYMSLKDFLWRWDADFYWGTENTLLQRPWVRKFFGESLLRSDRVLKLTKNKFIMFIQKLFQKKSGGHCTLNQDIGIPFKNWANYFEWYCAQINRFPVWLCTTKAKSTPLFQVKNDLYCDFGTFSGAFSDRISCLQSLQKIEHKMLELEGVKCFYSENALTEEAFFQIVDKTQYLHLKQKYDSDHTFPDLFEKVSILPPVQ